MIYLHKNLSKTNSTLPILNFYEKSKLTDRNNIKIFFSDIDFNIDGFLGNLY